MAKGWRPLRAALAAACAIAGSSAGQSLQADDGASKAAANSSAETKYLSFQLMTGLPGYSGPPPMPGLSSPGKAQLQAFVREVSRAIGKTGDNRHKLCFAVGPLCFDMSDDETRQFIRDAFAVARENDVAVAFHIDDSMTWGKRKDLLADPENIETAGWNEKPNTGRRADWGPTPTKFPPQMCFNGPGIVGAVKDRGRLIGAEIQKELAALKAEGKPHLFACVMTGWETQIGSDFETGRSLGYRALRHNGFSESKPPKDIDLGRVRVVKAFMELWANSLHDGGIPGERIFCHIAFTDQGLRKPDAKESYAEKVHFAVPEVAFSQAYRPGFSTYPEGATFNEVYAVLAKHGSPGWISAEGTNVSPTSMPGEPTMESYLARMFNHGAVMTNIFSWGIGGEAMRNSFFRKATENSEALAAYAKFLQGEPLVESAAKGFSSEAFQAKMRKIQGELQGWVERSGKQAQAMPLVQRLQGLVKEKKWQEADKVADQILALMNGDTEPRKAEPKGSTVQERLPAKMQQIQKKLPAWVQGNADRQKKATALMRTLDKQVKAKNFKGAEEAADAVLKLISGEAPIPDAQGRATLQEVPEEARRKLRHEFGGSFLITRDKVQEELKLTAGQKESLEQRLRELIPDAMQAFPKVEGMKPDARKKAFAAGRQKAQERLTAVLNEILNEAQRKRLRELVLRREGLFGDGESWSDLGVTAEQRKRFMAEIQQMQKKIAPMIEEARKAGNPDEVRPKVLKLREDLQAKLNALLTEEQRKQWNAMLGEPVDTSLLFDDVSPR